MASRVSRGDSRADTAIAIACAMVAALLLVLPPAPRDRVAAAIRGNLIGPLAAKLNETIELDSKPFGIVKAAIVAHANGLPTQVAVEIARRMTPSAKAPSFQQLEAALDEAKNDFNAVPA